MKYIPVYIIPKLTNLTDNLIKVQETLLKNILTKNNYNNL